jgi:chromosome segregation ATPase
MDLATESSEVETQRLIAARLRAETVTLRNELRRALAASDANANAYAEITTSRRALNDQLEASKADNARLSAELVALSNQLAVVDRTGEQFAAIRESAERELDDARKDFAAKLAAQHARIVTVERERDEIRARWDALVDETGAGEGEVAA